jgi:hypothetical protein
VPPNTVRCTCNDGFYGSGVVCAPCFCDKNAKETSKCVRGDLNTQLCTCNEGYQFAGDGRTCRINSTSSTCARTKSWILGNCQGVSASDVDALLGSGGGSNESKCTLPALSCPSYLSGSSLLLPAEFFSTVCLLVSVVLISSPWFA